MSKIKRTKRNFTIDSVLLQDFKETTKKRSKTYRTTIEEAITLWLKKQKSSERSF